MAHPDIVIAGAQFNQVPSIIVPKAGGGDAQFFDMSDDLSWMGADATLIKTLTPKTTKLKDTGYATWTPTTSAATVILPSETLTSDKFTATDIAEYNYIILWQMAMAIDYGTNTPTLKACPLYSLGQLTQTIYQRYSSWQNILDNVMNYTVASQTTLQSFLRYYGTTTGTETYTWSTSYGFYYTQTAPTISSTSAASPQITPKTPTMSTRCSTTYMSTANAALIDQDKTAVTITGKVYRVKAEAYMKGFYRYQAQALAALVNGT